MTNFSTLPPVRGRLKSNVALGPRTWFRCGGQADWLFVPEDIQDLAFFLGECPPELSQTVLGACSNVIIRDGGIEGVVIRLAGGFSDIIKDDDGLIIGAATLDVNIAEKAASYGLGGLEFLAGIPGSIGGAVAMNAGAYGGEIVQCLDWIECLDRQGNLKRYPASALNMSYRHSELPERSIVVKARLKATPEDPELIRQKITEIRTAREDSQPLKTRTGGSTFRNPDGHKAWMLIDQAKCRGLKIGDAQISEKHCNFMLNLGKASSAELELLGETVRQRVFDQTGISLQWEIKRIGRNLPVSNKL
ncbi:UDP-N-acetylmuramate dehydrogenase [Aristophania vespae]|uniref:UDP-N-acetylenolpyruvoylglucosamine reductase n=1 Tax=Aristophania vespae TaxID=2697033 RepID=A0A6P1NE18_9PROT|nr:UDP-N-acetylmuramate dehydrogenase [Aristophania vespae]QHI95749.1 UDP-N-acetylmuramate dehydrogenase [Aristophania vespae]